MEPKLEYADVFHKVLALNSRQEGYLQEVVDLLQAWTSCRCIGIRILHNGGYIPYEAITGFSKEFWLSENHLCIYRDECACTRVIKGFPEHQDLPAMTERGSFFTPNLPDFAAGLTEKELERFRGICIEWGFKTIAIVPIYNGENLIGALHLADEKADKMEIGTVHLVESFCDVIGLAHGSPLTDGTGCQVASS